MISNSINALEQYLTFTLGNELFAVDIGWVKEILNDKKITSIPRMPDFIQGVINVRGNAIPVVDLRLKFGMEKTTLTINTCIMITDLEINGEKTTVGMLSDSVQEVLEIKQEHINPPPKLGTAIDTKFISGMAQLDERFIIILDINRIFTSEELSAVQLVDQKEQDE